MKRINGWFLLLLLLAACTKSGIGDSATGTDGSAYSSSGSSGSGGSGSGGGSPNPAGVLTAGEWNDLAHWPFWDSLTGSPAYATMPAHWGFYTSGRITVELRDAGNRRVSDARLRLSGGGAVAEAVTNQQGRAELFPGLFAPGTATTYSLQAVYRNATYDLGPVAAGSAPLVRVLPVTETVAHTLDIQFVVDATGSMGDEITYLKNELRDVVQRAGNGLPGVQLRMGSVFYRDIGDDYVTRAYPFSTDFNGLNGFINAQAADGGGDFPEAVDKALETALQQAWSGEAVNRILFLILDAPPHREPEVLARLKASVAAASQRGVRIIPVVASGIDKETEFLMRFCAISTNGTYVFLTNHSGVGNPHLAPSVGPYQVEYLNNLMVRLITEYGKDTD